MEKLAKTINHMYEGILFNTKTGTHRFMTDIEKVKDLRNKFNQYNENTYSITENEYMKIKKDVGKGRGEVNQNSYCDEYYKRKSVIKESEIYEMIEKLKEVDTKAELFHELESIIDKKLVGTIQSIQTIESHFQNKKENELNVLIAGGGPNGLFLANYINQLYNTVYSDVKVNVLVIENRVDEETIRMPFTRNRFFAIGTRYLEIVLPNFYCRREKKTNGDGFYIPIKYLEMLFYLKCFENAIPLYFTKRYNDEKSIKGLIEKLKIDVVYDSTGGRMDGFPMNMNDLSLKQKIEKQNTNMKKGMKFMMNHNKVIFDYPDELKRYVSVDFYGKKSFFHEPKTFPVNDEEDYEMMKKKCIPKNKFEKWVFGIKEIELQKLLLGFYQKEIQKKGEIEYIQLQSFEMKMYHRLKVSQVMKVKDHSFLYIGTGDTIFSSHYIVGAGLNRTLLFSIKTCHLFPFLVS